MKPYEVLKSVIMSGVTARTPSLSNTCSLTTMLSAHMLVLGDAGLTMSSSCSLDESQHSLTGGRRFGSTALPLLFGVPTLGSDARFQGLRLTASPSCSLVGSQPSLARGRRFGSTALPLLVGATGSLLGGACYRQQLIVDWE